LPVCSNCGEDNPERAKFCLACGRALGIRRAREQDGRKTVTVVFCDLAGSTALGEVLEPETLWEVLDRYFEAMRGALERHGGVVEKYIGDAIMAVFGLGQISEDDALRAVRAAYDMGEALQALNVELSKDYGIELVNRTGVNTGEVIVGDTAVGQRLATGDAVNVAARLEQTAPPKGILLGEATFALVRDAVVVEPITPLLLKGKGEPMPAFRLEAVHRRAEGVSRRLDAPLVGREAELKATERAFARVIERHTCQLLTILGEAGVGKSRFMAEVELRLTDRATILLGRCPSYGTEATYWPLAEVVKQAAGISESDSVEEATLKLRAVAGNAADSESIVNAVATLTGLRSGVSL
jgi:class 3 adenylate cyclase